MFLTVSFSSIFTFSRIQRIENQLEWRFEKMTSTLRDLSDFIRKSEQHETFNVLTAKWNHLERIPCMCCDKSSNSFDKSFLSKEEGKELLCSSSEANLMANSQSLQCLEQLACEMELSKAEPSGESSQLEVVPDRYCLAVSHNQRSTSPKMAVVAQSELISFSCESTTENTLDCISSIDTCKETSFLMNHSEPLLNRCTTIRNRSRLSPWTTTLSKSLSQLNLPKRLAFTKK